MKRSILPLILGIIPAACLGQKCIQPLVASEFGKPVAVTAEFVGKPNTYYAQNLVKEPFLLKVVSVDGRTLNVPVVIEYILEADKKVAKQLARAGVKQEFEAYETLYQPAFASPWLAEGEQGMAFTLMHQLHIRPGTNASSCAKPRQGTPATTPAAPTTPGAGHP